MTRQKQIAYSRAMAIVRKHFPNVNKVNDADGDIAVEVTGRDVGTSKRKNHEACAMAVACKRAMHLDGVIISVNRAYLIKGDTATRFYVPESVSREVISFDRGASFEQGTYTLKKPDTKLGERGGHVGQKSGGHSRKRPHVLTKNIRAVLGSENER